jgi:hypothetical protein
MTPEQLGNELTNLKISLSAYRAEVSAQNCITNAALSGINTRLDKVNGNIGELQSESNKRMVVVQEFREHVESQKDFPQKIRKLEDESLTNRSVKKYMWAMFTGGIALASMVIGLLKLIIG